MAQDDQVRDPHNRQNKRSLVLLAAKIRTASGSDEVKLRNLSRKGALLEGLTPPAVGSELVFERGQTVAKARVAWQSDNRFGIEFLEPIEESEVLVHVGRGAKAPSSIPEPGRVFRRSGLRAAPLKSGEQKIAADWVRPGGRARTLGD
jgi:PilZ domain